MNDREKLRHLLQHWMEHNLEHAEVYSEWASKALSSGDEDLSGILESLCAETRKLNGLFEEALKRV